MEARAGVQVELGGAPGTERRRRLSGAEPAVGDAAVGSSIRLVTPKREPSNLYHQPERAVTIGPWKSTEFYVNAGTGFHSNNALGTTLTRDPKAIPSIRSRHWSARMAPSSASGPWPCRICRPRCHSGLRLGSELVYNGDVGATEPGPAQQALRHRSRQLLQPEAVARVRRRRVAVAGPFPGTARDGKYVPEAVDVVVSAARAWTTSTVRSAASGAVFRTARAGRRQLGPVEGDDPPQPRRRLPGRQGTCV